MFNNVQPEESHHADESATTSIPTLLDLDVEPAGPAPREDELDLPGDADIVVERDEVPPPSDPPPPPPAYRPSERLRWIIESLYYDGHDLADELTRCGLAPIALGRVRVGTTVQPSKREFEAFVNACVRSSGGTVLKCRPHSAGGIVVTYTSLPLDDSERPVDGTKRPTLPDWRNAALTLDWWRWGYKIEVATRGGSRRHLHGSPERNVGIRTGDGLIVIDIDRKDGKDGLAALVEKFGDALFAMFPPTFVVETPSGGLHLYYWTTIRISNSTSKLAGGVDIRGDGGMIVAPGSIRADGRKYWPLNYDEVSHLPDETAELLLSLKPAYAAPEDTDSEPFDPNAFPSEDRLERASRYLAKVPAAIQGKGGRTHTFIVAGYLVKGFALHVDQALALMLAEWNTRCEPPWDEEGLRERVKSAAHDFSMGVGAMLTRSWKAPGGNHDAPESIDEIASLYAGSFAGQGTTATTAAVPPPPVSRIIQRGDQAELAALHVSLMPGPAVFAEGRTHVYRDGVWRAIDDMKQVAVIQKFAGATVQNNGKPHPLRLSADTARGILYFARALTARADFFSEATPGLAFANGFLRERDDALVLEPHSPEHRARFAYAFEYDENAKCDRWQEYLASVWEGDADAPDKTSALQEFVGACLFGAAARFKTAVILFGNTDSGKSTCIEVVRGLFPAGAVTTVGLHDFEQEYRRAKLAGKLLNTIPEVPSSDLVKSEAFKAIIAGDVIEGREIRGTPFDFRPVAGHLFAANTLPRINDRSEATWSRWILLAFNRHFSRKGGKGPRAKQGLADAILSSERQGVLAWAAAGYQRLIGAGRYTIPASSEIGMNAWKKDSDTIELFFDAELELHEKGRLESDEAYRRYRTWCEEHGFNKPFAHPTFSRGLAGVLRRLLETDEISVTIKGYTVFIGVRAKQHDPGLRNVDWTRHVS